LHHRSINFLQTDTNYQKLKNKNIYKDLVKSSSENKKSLAVLIDPDKMKLENLSGFITKVNRSIATHIFVGGSEVDINITDIIIKNIKPLTDLPIIIFPGSTNQISEQADALLFLSLVSGDNPEYLIGQQRKAVPKLRNSSLEILSTGYILIENGKSTSVEKVTQTKPMSRTDVQKIADTAKAGDMLGMKLIYLEAGSGAIHPVPPEIINFVKRDLNIPLIVGGGIRSKEQLDAAYKAGADLVVIGTAFEEDEGFFKEIKKE